MSHHLGSPPGFIKGAGRSLVEANPARTHFSGGNSYGSLCRHQRARLENPVVLGGVGCRGGGQSAVGRAEVLGHLAALAPPVVVLTAAVGTVGSGLAMGLDDADRVNLEAPYVQLPGDGDGVLESL